jgi:two-component system, NtrC family, sensor kinase
VDEVVTTGRTTRPKTKRRSPSKAPRRSATTEAPQTSDKKKIALLTRKLKEAAAEQKAASKRQAATSRELSEAREQQTATADVLKVISRSKFELQPVLDTLAESATRLCDAKDACIYLRDGDLYRVAARYGFSPNFQEYLEEHPTPTDRGSAIGRAALERRVIHIPDVLADPGYSRHDTQKISGYRAVLAAPLLRDGNAVGAIFVARTLPEPFTDKQIELVTTFADQAVIAIENVRLFDEVQARTRDLTETLEYQTATSDVLKVISGSKFDLQPVLDTMLETAARLCEADIGVIRRRDGDSYPLAATFGYKPEWRAHSETYPTTPTRGSIFGRTVIEGRTVHVPDVLADPEFTRSDTQSLIGFRAVLSVPLMREGNLIGIMACQRFKPGNFTPKQIELLETFADQAVIAIENVRLFEEVQARTGELTESLEQQTATSEVLGVISSSPGELQSVFQAILANATRLCEASFGILYRYDGNVFHTEAMRDVSPEFAEYLRREPNRADPRNALGRMLRKRQPVHIPDVTAEPAFAEREPTRIALVEIGKARTFLAIPMLKEGELLGAICIYRHEVRQFTDKQIALVTNFARQAVIAIENARLLAELRESLEQQTATADVLKVISRSTFELQPVLDALVESAVRLCSGDNAFIYLREGEAYRLASNSGFAPEYADFLKQRTISPGRDTLTGRIVLERSIVHIPDVEIDPEYGWYEAQKRSGYPDHVGRSALAGGNADWSDFGDALDRAAVHGQADRAGDYIRRPSRDRHRERAVVR